MESFERTVSEEDLARLKADREAADRRYNETLTELDAAIQQLPELPHPPPAPDETQVTPLNERWRIVPAQPAIPAGWRGRIAQVAWAMAAPVFEAQQTFNAALVDHVNRNVAHQRAVVAAIDAALATLRVQLELLIRFQSRLIVYLQQITPYVDTKDYEFRGLGQRVAEDIAEAQWEMARTVRGLAAALSAVSDDVLQRWERYEGLRSAIATLQQAVHALKREMDAAGGQAVHVHRPATDSRPDDARARPDPNPDVSYALSSSPRDSYKYVAFEDAFRGDPADIRERQQAYLPLFAQRSDVLDIGCGRGEFLRLLREHGVTARGVDSNYTMVAQCREAGLMVEEADALQYVRALPDDSLGGVIAAQVVEHLQPEYLIALLGELYRVLRTGSPLALETINVASWYAFFSSYVRDITHARPIHPDTLRFLVTASGFLDVEIRLMAPLPQDAQLRRAPDAAHAVDGPTIGDQGRALLALVNTFDLNVERLNRQLYGPQDYAVIARKR